MAASRLYLNLIKTAEPYVPKKLLPLWNHDAGPKTIFFWAPTVKWIELMSYLNADIRFNMGLIPYLHNSKGLVIAGLADVARPAEKLSFNQSFTLACTGTIWSRYSLVIIPKSWYLFSVNFFVANIGILQLFRIWNYNRTHPKLKNETAPL